VSNKRKRALDLLNSKLPNRQQSRDDARAPVVAPQPPPLPQLAIPRVILTSPVDEDDPDYRRWTGITLGDGRRAVFAFSSSDDARKFCEGAALGPEWRIECLGYDSLERWLELNLREGDAVLIRNADCFGPRMAFTATIVDILEALLSRDHDPGELMAGFQMQFILPTIADRHIFRIDRASASIAPQAEV
jgi:hypothetical protein